MHFLYWSSLGLSFVVDNSLEFPSLWVVVSSLGEGHVALVACSNQQVTFNFQFDTDSHFVTCVYGCVFLLIAGNYGITL